MEQGNVWIALGMTMFAGLSTGVGSALAFFARQTNTRLMSVALGFSAGVMIYVSFVEIFPEADVSLSAFVGTSGGCWITAGAFFAGMGLIALIDKLVPDYENPHEIKSIEDMDDPRQAQQVRDMFRLGVMSALAIAIHNFPEGLATFTAALKDPALGAPVAVAIAIHNIPEGIAVSLPIYYATGNPWKAFYLSFASGLAEPVGALLGYLILMPFMNDLVFGLLFASVAGIMVFISLDELLPAAERYGQHHLSIYGVVGGMAVMALSLLLLG